LTEDQRAQRVLALNIFFLAVIIIVVLIVAVRAQENPSVQGVSGALTILSTFAQVSATIAGFLIVGLIFLIQSRATKGEPLVLMSMYDIIFFGAATVVFSLTTINATDGLRYVASQTLVDFRTTDFLRWTLALMWAGYVLATAGFSVLVVNYKDRMKKIRLR